MIEHTSDIMARFQGKINEMAKVLSLNFNFYKLKFFESEALVYLNEIYQDLNAAMDNKKYHAHLSKEDNLENISTFSKRN